MTAATEAIISLYSMTEADILQLQAALFEQLRASWLAQMATLARQHGSPNATPQLQGAEYERLQAKALEDAQSIAATYNRELRSQVNAIAARNPSADRSEYISTLSSWGRERGERKSITIAIGVILWAAQYGHELFMTRNNLQYQLFKAIGATPVCPECIRVVAMGVVSYQFTVDNPLPFHPNCSHEYVPINPSDLGSLGIAAWVG
jgi:hypothetical protein